MRKCKTTETYRTAPDLPGIILQSSLCFDGLHIVALRYGDCDWRLRHINEKDLIIQEDFE
jgi:hypothetical protein